MAEAAVSGTSNPPSRRSSAFVRSGTVLLLLLLAFIPVLSTVAGGNYLVLSVTRFMIMAIAALSLNLLIGVAGLVSFGHAAYLGIGAYATGILAVNGHDDLTIALPAAMLASGAFALLTGAIAIRTRGVYFIMITLAFAQMAFYIAGSLSLYGGDDGLTLPGRSLILGQPLLKREGALFYLVLALLALVSTGLTALMSSPFGRVLDGLRQNRQRVEALGFASFGYQLVAYVVAGMICGLAGCLLANSTEFVSPAFMTWQRSGDLIIMVILGGAGSRNGAILGAFAYLLLEEGLSHLTEHWKALLGPLLVAFVLFAPGGLGKIFRSRARG